MSKINKSIDLSGLPTYYKGIDWKNSLGIKIPFIYGDMIGEIEITEYINDDKVNIKYKDNIYEMNKDCIKRCALAYVVGERTKEYKYSIGEQVEVNTGLVVIIDQIRTHDINCTQRGYLVRCKKDNHEYTVTEYNLKNGHGCPLCTNQVVVRYINDMGTTNPISLLYVDKIEDAYINARYTKNKILFKCPHCGFKKEMIISDFSSDGFSCNKCGDGISYPNKIAFNLLEQLGLEFIPEYSPDWIKPKKYDFYFEINNVKYILEMDGGWHDKDNTLSGKSKEESNENDSYKDKMANTHEINVIRVASNISRLEDIKENILKSSLKSVIDLTNINWEKCEVYALTSLVKMACDYWNSGMHNCVEIGNMMKINNNTICKYLKRGTKIGLCSYSVEKVEAIKKEKLLINVYQLKTRPIKCIETNHVFGSMSLCTRLSEDILGFKTSGRSLTNVLTGINSHTHHKHFKYITKQEFNTIKTQSPELAFGDFFIIQNITEEAS